jgi:formamidopyrimidine-DNA glycosylase
VEVLQTRLRHAVDPRLSSQLIGKRIAAIERVAKYILFSLDGDWVWLFHLGMSGKLIHVAPEIPRQKHDHILVSLDNGKELRYHDPRRFGLSLLVRKTELDKLPQLRALGKDPFEPGFTGKYLLGFTRRSERRLRDLLLDQRVLAGVGNIYANEILFRAGVRPTLRSFRLTQKQADRVAAMTSEVLSEAIRWCGTSFSDYRDADDQFGEFQNHLRVYDREGEPCRVCRGKIKRVSLGNRSAFYCRTCQK